MRRVGEAEKPSTCERGVSACFLLPSSFQYGPLPHQGSASCADVSTNQTTAPPGVCFRGCLSGTQVQQHHVATADTGKPTGKVRDQCEQRYDQSRSRVPCMPMGLARPGCHLMATSTEVCKSLFMQNRVGFEILQGRMSVGSDQDEQFPTNLPTANHNPIPQVRSQLPHFAHLPNPCWRDSCADPRSGTWTMAGVQQHPARPHPQHSASQPSRPRVAKL